MVLLKKALIIPDCHIGHEDKRAYNLMLKVAKKIKIDEIVILGDYADFFAVNSHGSHPQVLPMIIDEVDAVKKRLDELDKLFPKAKKIYIEGNHEHRIERFLLNNAPALFGVTSTEHLLDINRRPNWKFVKYGPNQSYKILGSKLKARHEPLGSSAKATASKALTSLVYGHIHRIEESHVVGLDGTNHVCFSVGWLGDKSADKIFGYVKSHHQWQLGFGLVYVNEKTKYFYHDKIHILDNYTCVANGKLYKG